MSMKRNGMNDETDKIAAVLMQAWEDAEGKKVNASYIATFADMAKAVQEWLDTHPRGVLE
jgi:hypothetical protein